MPDEETKQEYRDAYERRQRQLVGLHESLLDGRRLDPVSTKALLNRESSVKRRYDGARLGLLGVETDDPGDDAGEPRLVAVAASA